LATAKREKTAQALADPLEYEDMFPDLQYGLLAEQAVKEARETPVPATSYFAWKESLDRDIISGAFHIHVLLVALLRDREWENNCCLKYPCPNGYPIFFTLVIYS